MSSPSLTATTTNSKQYLTFLTIYKQIAKNSILLTDQYYETNK